MFLTIMKLRPVDEFSFELEWSDGIIHFFELNELQTHCPCIRCSLMNKHTSTPQIQADHIRSIGNYAIQIQFRSGCSSGIYPYPLLRLLGKSSSLSSRDQ